MSPIFRMSQAFILAIIAWNSGCGPSSSSYKAPEFQTITGRIRFQGEPLITGKISFENVDTDRQTTAQIQKDGTYSISATNQSPGLSVGIYRTIIVNGETASYEALPPEYFNFPSTPLKIEILANKSEYLIDIVSTREQTSDGVSEE